MRLNIWKAIIVTLLFYLLSEILGLLLLLTLFCDDSISCNLWGDSLISLAYNFLLFLFVYYYLKKSKILEEITLIGAKWQYISLAVALGIVFVYLQDLLNSFYDILFSSSPINDSAVEKLNFEFYRLPKLFTRSLIIPIIHELFFRGFILKELNKSYGGIIALLISSSLFALIHVDFHSIYITFFGGIIAGMIYLKTEKLLYPILFHIAWNLVIAFDKFIDIPLL